MLARFPFAQCYINDIIIFSNTSQEHVKPLQIIWERLRKWGLRLHHGKCQFFHDRLFYLRHMIILKGFGVQQTKVDALLKIPTPNNVLQLCVFLGLAN